MKKYLYICAIVLMTALLAIEYGNTFSSVSAFANAGGKKPIYKVDTQEKKVAISFDAAWGADKTEKILDILDSYEVHATFFLVGFWVEKYPEMVKEIDARGYEIGNHSQNHPQMSKLSKEQMKKEITSVNEKISALINKTPTVFRPPFGDYNDCVIETMQELNMHTIQWSIDSLDWKELGKEALVSRVLKKVECGDIILFHNNAKYTPDALPEILEELQARGFSVCSVGELIYKENYFVNNQGIQKENLR
ncbi:MAG: polysaccharide deacetylase family sporulation protein PdaB [Clostridia bacterium]|nr:polysaccharide deacetylase family sporulation protein PdaB [Clostridia bacterium]